MASGDGRLVAKGPIQPAREQAAAHGSRGAVEYSNERMFSAAILLLIDLEIPPRSRIEEKRLVVTLATQAA